MIADKRKKNYVSGAMPDLIVSLTHPDFNRRPRNYTVSADLFAKAKSDRGLSSCSPRSVTARRDEKC
ncbi:hypothetical protein, partial [Salmonella enterica]|uniref:hypothetical protein n=1 Tax=Salmonella enterica TaxID=28901 RepID=UPI001C995B68